MTGKEIDCDDPKNKDQIACTFGEIIAFPALVVIMTLAVWVVGAVLIALVSYMSPRNHKTIILTGIVLCILVAPVGILLLQKFAHWPMHNL